MVKEAWDSFKENIKDRITNPFLGTFIIVWIAHNWKIVYAFFNFDKESKLENRIKYFNDYWASKSFFWNLIYVALITIGILIITYLFLAISRYLANLFENVIIPNIQRMSKGKTVTQETHQIALDKILLLEGKIEIERKAKNDAVSERDEFEKRFYDSLKVEEPENKGIDISYKNLMDKANTNFGKEEFENTLLSISKSDYFKSNNKAIDFLLKNRLIETVRRGGENYYYKFNNSGNDFLKQYFQDK